MPERLKVAIVNGYGVVLDKSYKKHLNIVIKRGEEFKYIVVSGGRTSEYNFDLTESSIMAGYLEKRNYQIAYQKKIIQEGDALTTRQNLVFSKAKLEEKFKFRLSQKSITPLRVIVFCKKPWWIKVRLLSWLIFRPRDKWKVKVVGTAPANGWKEYVKQFLAVPYEISSHFVHKLEELKIRKKFPWKF